MNKFNFYSSIKIELASKHYLNYLKNYMLLLNKKIYNCLSMFPYPSGLFHMGHFRLYIIYDIINRYLGISGFKSIGYFAWDSFGLPAENYAIKNFVSPYYWTNRNICLMLKQLSLIFLFVNWRRQFTTNSNRFCKLNQNLFSIFYSKKILIRIKAWVNWDLIDLTELSNEQCFNNLCWRSGVPIVKHIIYSYYINVIKIAKFLYLSLYKVNFPIYVRKSQLNWINLVVYFKVFIVFNYLIFNLNFKYIIYLFYSFKILIPLGNDIFFANIIKFSNRYYKLGSYLTPCNKDVFSGLYCCFYIFKVCYIPIYFNKLSYFCVFLQRIFFNKLLNINFIKYLNILKLKLYLKYLFFFVKNYCFNINNWCITRRRYWGTPVPILDCPNCSRNLVLNRYYPLNVSSIDYFGKFLYRCFKCMKIFLTKSITLDTFFDSSWYFICYFTKLFLYKKFINININLYIGGKEHSLLHLLYVRIFFYYLYLLKIFKFNNPLNKVVCVGLVLNKIYFVFLKNKPLIRKIKYLYFYKICYFKLGKMSKSFGKYVNPVNIISLYGSDSLRMYVVSFASIYKDIIWTDKRIIGSYRILRNLWNFFIDNRGYSKIIKLNQSVLFCLYKKILYYYQMIYLSYRKIRLNLVVSFINIQFNNIVSLYKYLINNIYKTIYYRLVFILLLFLYPICPSISIILINIFNVFNIKNIYLDIFYKLFYGVGYIIYN